jgi:hypothetical protein
MNRFNLLPVLGMAGTRLFLSVVLIQDLGKFAAICRVGKRYVGSLYSYHMPRGTLTRYPLVW